VDSRATYEQTKTQSSGEIERAMAATFSSLVGLAVGGKYEIRKVLGVGGMGVVCEAIHLDLGKKVAIKLIDKTMKESELIVQRFRREARAAGQIQSEHIVDVFDVGADARVGLYMVMEHLAGEDLSARLERDKKIDVKTGVMLGHQIARGLAKAHEAGVIHRDLKPANIFLTTRDNGQMLVKLLDFGVSKLLHEAGGARITGSGAPIGTPLYMSPEQAEGKDDVDGRADIWSLGAVLYEALAGAPPFADRGSYHGTIVGILTSRPKLLQDAAPWVPAELAKAVDAMLVHDPDARIANATLVTQRLLEAYPAVLPDGTGRHTAVIVPQAQAAVDAVGDTEFFTSGSISAAMKAASRSSAPNPPASGPTSGRPSGEAAARASNPFSHQPSAPPPSAEDSSKTVPDMPTGPGLGTAATRTAAATPVGGAAGENPFAGPGKRSPKTTPIPPMNPSSSAGGIAMLTPGRIDPLPTPHPPLSEIAPDTTRDDALAVRAERRRWFSLAVIFAAIIGVAVGGYVAGRRTGPSPGTSSTVSATQPPAPTMTIPSAGTTTTPAPPEASSAPAPPVSASASALGSIPAPATGTAPRIIKRPRPFVRPAASTKEPTPTPYDTPPEPPPSND